MADATPVLGKYRRIAELGHGGMATAYLCVARGPGGFNKLQVIKCLRADLATDSDAVRMFLEEARISARLNHPNVVQTYEVGHDGRHPFIAMEYVEGQTLERLTRRARTQSLDCMIPLRIHLEILVQVLAGLHFAHELTGFDGKPLHLVHRDVSPHNVMVTYDGHVKILDFGIAKAADSSEQTAMGLMKGKYAYMAPEQCGTGPVDRRADIYAVGVMLWHAITGQRMWRGMQGTEVLTRVVAGTIPTPQEVKPNIDPTLATICMKALARNRAERYSTAAELQASLEDYLSTGSSRPRARELGQYVQQVAQDSRSRIRAAIESELAKSSTSPSTEDIPVLWTTETVSSSGVQSASESTVDAAAALQKVRKRLKFSVGIGAGALAPLAIITGLLLRSSPGAAPRAVAAAVPSANVILLKVAASPAQAKLYLDDTELSSNPATVRLPRDMAAHRVSARASGYESKSELVTFDAETASADIALERVSPPPVTSSVPRSHAPAPVSVAIKLAPTKPSATPAPAAPNGQPTAWQMLSGPPTPTTRALDNSNPWSNAE